jgi:hypothetical protein
MLSQKVSSMAACTGGRSGLPSNVDITAARRWVYGYLLLMGLYIPEKGLLLFFSRLLKKCTAMPLSHKEEPGAWQLPDSSLIGPGCVSSRA